MALRLDGGEAGGPDDEGTAPPAGEVIAVAGKRLAVGGEHLLRHQLVGVVAPHPEHGLPRVGGHGEEHRPRFVGVDLVPREHQLMRAERGGRAAVGNEIVDPDHRIEAVVVGQAAGAVDDVEVGQFLGTGREGRQHGGLEAERPMRDVPPDRPVHEQLQAVEGLRLGAVVELDVVRVERAWLIHARSGDDDDVQAVADAAGAVDALEGGRSGGAGRFESGPDAKRDAAGLIERQPHGGRRGIDASQDGPGQDGPEIHARFPDGGWRVYPLARRPS
ncbi:MAG: hypothetical protein R2712_07055 [Vicinamibacterales bacterium]